MYVRILNFECRANVGEEDIHKTYLEVIEPVSKLDGFAGSTLLMADDDCRGMALVFWRDKDAAANASSQFIGLLSERIHAVLEEPPHIQGYNVLDDRGILNGNCR
jgi:heme-degrading monooxygenase HmoA